MSRYYYNGPVVMFDRCVQNNWKAETIAKSEAKAKSNLAYQWKKNNGIGFARIALPGELQIIN